MHARLRLAQQSRLVTYCAAHFTTTYLPDYNEAFFATCRVKTVSVNEQPVGACAHLGPASMTASP